MLYLIEEATQVLWTWAHAKCVERTVKHVSLDASLMERLCPLAYCDIWVLAIEEVNLLEATAISFYTVETSHLDDSWSDLQKLVNTWLILSGTLPHITEDQTELYLFCHCILYRFFVITPLLRLLLFPFHL